MCVSVCFGVRVKWVASLLPGVVLFCVEHNPEVHVVIDRCISVWVRIGVFVPYNKHRVLHEEGRVEFDNRAVFAFAVYWLEQRLAGELPK